MTKKHFIAVAKIIAAYQTTDDYDSDLARRCIARDLAAEFAKCNPLFDRARFLAACKVEG